jgi:Two component regulator propeller
MKILRLILLGFLFLLSIKNTLIAQNDLKIGQWRTYLPYHQGNDVTQSNTHVYWATGLSILEMNKTDFSINRLDKNNALSDVGTSIIRYNKANETLLVYYQNSSIDLLKPGGTTILLNDIKNNTTIIGDKGLNDVFFKGDTAYLSCSFGIVRLDMKRNEFISTTFTKLKTYSISVLNNQIYAATEGGLYTIANDSRVNLADFKQWRKLSTTDGFPSNYTSNLLCVFNEKLYFTINDSLFTFQNNRPLSIFSENGFKMKFLTAEGSSLMLGMTCQDNCDGKVYLFDKNLQRTTVANNCNDRPIYGVQDARGWLWFADGYQGFRFTSGGTANCATSEFDSPNFITSSDFAITDTSFYVAAGGLEGFNARRSPDGFASFINGKWRNYSRGTDRVLLDSFADLDFYRIIFNPRNKKVHVGTYWGGLVELENGKITKIYNDNNSALQGAVGDPLRERVAGLAYDKKGNLWISNNLAPNPVVVLKADGKWQKMKDVPFGANGTQQLVIDSIGYKWLAVGGAQSGLLVYDEGKDIETLTDDRVSFLDNGTLPKDLQNARVNCLAVDIDGRVWVGTSSGVAFYACGSDPFKSNCTGQLVVSGLGGIGEYLLKDKNVTAIAVDGANRKWFGTSNGIFVQSADGREEVAVFNIENSPLLSNNITALGIRGSTGEVFIGTDKGLMSYRTDAITGGSFNKDTAYGYPNPVRPDYDGPIAIKGLARDALVKITDVNGNIVFESRALGGQAIWDGRDFSGRRVSTGVYLVFAANTRNVEAGDAMVTKILFIN